MNELNISLKEAINIDSQNPYKYLYDDDCIDIENYLYKSAFSTNYVGIDKYQKIIKEEEKRRKEEEKQRKETEEWMKQQKEKEKKKEILKEKIEIFKEKIEYSTKLSFNYNYYWFFNDTDIRDLISGNMKNGYLFIGNGDEHEILAIMNLYYEIYDCYPVMIFYIEDNFVFYYYTWSKKKIFKYHVYGFTFNIHEFYNNLCNCIVNCEIENKDLEKELKTFSDLQHQKCYNYFNKKKEGLLNYIKSTGIVWDTRYPNTFWLKGSYTYDEISYILYGLTYVYLHIYCIDPVLVVNDTSDNIFKLCRSNCQIINGDIDFISKEIDTLWEQAKGLYNNPLANKEEKA